MRPSSQKDSVRSAWLVAHSYQYPQHSKHKWICITPYRENKIHCWTVWHTPHYVKLTCVAASLVRVIHLTEKGQLLLLWANPKLILSGNLRKIIFLIFYLSILPFCIGLFWIKTLFSRSFVMLNINKSLKSKYLNFLFPKYNVLQFLNSISKILWCCWTVVWEMYPDYFGK